MKVHFDLGTFWFGYILTVIPQQRNCQCTVKIFVLYLAFHILRCSDASRISKLWGICPLNLAKRGHLKLRRVHCKKYYFLYIEVINWLRNSFLNPLLFKSLCLTPSFIRNGSSWESNICI